MQNIVSSDITITALIIFLLITYYSNIIIRLIKNTYDQSMDNYSILQSIGGKYFSTKHKYNINTNNINRILKTQINKIISEIEDHNMQEIKNIKSNIATLQCNTVLKIQQYKEQKTRECISQLINIYFTEIIKNIFD